MAYVNTVPLINGSSLFIGGKIAMKPSMSAGDFSSQTWTEVGGYTSEPEISETYDVQKVKLINQARVVNVKGTIDSNAAQPRFLKLVGDAGQNALRAAFRSKCNYAFKISESSGDCEASAVVTISNATPGVVTWPAHGLSNGAAVVLSTTGTLPTGLTAGTTYYVTGSTTGTFSLAATVGGTAINTTGAGSGIHTATALAAGVTRLFAGIVTVNTDPGGAADAVREFSVTIQINSDQIIV